MLISGQDSDISGNLLSPETEVANNPDLMYGWSDMLEECMALKSKFVTCSIILFTKGNSQISPYKPGQAPLTPRLWDSQNF